MPPLVVEQCWPVKKARRNGCRKKRRFDPLLQTKPVLQFEPVFDAHEPILQTEPVLELVVQSETVAEVEEVHQVKHAEVLGRAVGRPTDRGKITSSINKLYVVEVENSKKSSGKKRQKK